MPALKCRECGAVLLNNESDAHLSSAFRERLKLLQPETIREGRKRLSLNQREFAELLGVAEESVSRWETGAQMQSRVVDKIMRVYFASPEARKVLDAARTDATVGISNDCSEYGPANDRKDTSNGNEQILAEEQRAMGTWCPPSPSGRGEEAALTPTTTMGTSCPTSCPPSPGVHCEQSVIVRGRVQNGVVVLEAASVPEGTEVAVVVPVGPSPASPAVPEAERQRIREVMDRIAVLPDEKPGDRFSGADHDKVLYGP